MKKQQVLIVGGGFGGLKAALELADDDRFKITLISDRETFRYYPTLYHTAVGGLRRQSSIPVAELLGNKKIAFIMGSVVAIDRKAKIVTLQDKRTYTYDTAIIGLGVVTNYFGIPGMQQLSFSIKSIEEIVRFQKHVHQYLVDEKRPDENYVIVGAGPTGIELAGALPQYMRRVLDKHGIKHRAIHVDLVEAGPRLLPRFPKDVSRSITRRLRRLGVKIYTNSAVQGLAADNLTVNGRPIRSHTVIWTAGVTNHPFFKDNNFQLSNRGKVMTDMYLQADDNVYVIGDNANTPYSGMAQTALYDGAYVAKVLKHKAGGKDPKDYAVKKPITIIPVGERWAAVMWGQVRMYGWIGWALRNAADFMGFKDYQPWWKATEQWLTEFGEEEYCPVCLDADGAGGYTKDYS